MPLLQDKTRQMPSADQKGANRDPLTSNYAKHVPCHAASCDRDHDIPLARGLYIGRFAARLAFATAHRRRYMPFTGSSCS